MTFLTGIKIPDCQLHLVYRNSREREGMNLKVSLENNDIMYLNVSNNHNVFWYDACHYCYPYSRRSQTSTHLQRVSIFVYTVSIRSYILLSDKLSIVQPQYIITYRKFKLDESSVRGFRVCLSSWYRRVLIHIIILYNGASPQRSSSFAVVGIRPQ